MRESMKTSVLHRSRDKGSLCSIDGLGEQLEPPRACTKPHAKSCPWFELFGGYLYLFCLTNAGLAQAPLFEWAIKAGGTRSDTSYAIAMDTATNLYVAGLFTGTSTFGTTNIVNSSTNINEPNLFI